MKAQDMDMLRQGVLRKYPYFGGLAARIFCRARDDIRTMASDGETIFYNPEWIKTLTEDQGQFALAHELCHIAFQHIPRSIGKDMEVWSAATDAVINQFLMRDGLSPFPGAIDYPEAIDYDAESYYRVLLEGKLEIELEGGQLEGRQSPEASGGQRQDSGDEHSLWEEAAAKEQQKQEDHDEELLKELEKIRALAEEDLFRMAEELDEETFEKLKQEEEEGPAGRREGDPDEEEEGLLARKVSKAGNSVNRDRRKVRRIGAGPPLIDWRLLLRDTINYGVDWSFDHAVIEGGIVRPALEERPMPETEIVLDTSWSVDEELLRNFLRECKNLLQLSRVKAGCFDTVFYGFQEIKTEADIDEMVFEGGGGTDFDVATGAFTLRVDNRIIFTDGQAPMPKEALDAIWVVYGGEAIEPKGGKVIHISDEQLSRLLGE